MPSRAAERRTRRKPVLRIVTVQKIGSVIWLVRGGHPGSAATRKLMTRQYIQIVVVKRLLRMKTTMPGCR
ncbi:hypothetical protein GCK32_021113 [Trichostrongylus colubriformis]